MASTSNYCLTIEITGLKNQQGTVCLNLFSNEQGFPNQSDRAVATQYIQANEAPLTATFEQLTPGEYAVAVMHDANADGELNTGIFGIPKEGFGFSRNPKIGTSAPSFQESAIVLSDENTQIQIELRYLL